MSNKIGIVFVHGMGGFSRGYASGMCNRLYEHFTKDKIVQVETIEVIYSDLAANGKAALRRSSERYGLHLNKIRNLLINTLSDPATIMNSSNTAAYHNLTTKIKAAIDQHRRNLGRDCKIVFITHSLGCQVVSNFIWDAQRNKLPSHLRLDKSYSDDVVGFITMGCNIPLFNANIYVPLCFDRPNEKFRWVNYYSKWDLLGYPLIAMGGKYSQMVEDVEIRNGYLNAHNNYWSNKKLADKVYQIIKGFIV